MADTRYTTIGGEQCQNCGRRHKICWKAPDWLWQRVVGKEGGKICIECFDALSSAHGVALEWECKPHKIYNKEEGDG